MFNIKANFLKQRSKQSPNLLAFVEQLYEQSDKKFSFCVITKRTAS